MANIIVPAVSKNTWARLYNATLAFKELRPWEFMSDSEIFGVQDPVSKQIGYCCVLGALAQVFGLAVYRGSKGLELYLRLASGDLDPVIDDLFAIQDVLMAEFVNKGELRKEDIKIIQDLDIKVKGKKGYPIFISHLPGYYPWFLTHQEAEFLTFAMKCACDMAKEFKVNPDVLNPPDRGLFLTYFIENNNAGFVRKWIAPQIIEEEEIIAPPVDELQLKKITKMNLKRDNIWEVGAFYNHRIIKGEDRPYWMHLSVVAHHDSAFLFSYELFSPIEKHYLVIRKSLLEAILKHSIKPEEILLSDELAFDVLKPLSDVLGIRLSLVDDLPAIMEAKAELSKMPAMR